MSLATFGKPAKIFMRMHWLFLHSEVGSPFLNGAITQFFTAILSTDLAHCLMR